MLALPGLNRLVSATDRIFSRWPDDVKTPPESDRERLVQEMRSRVDADNWNGAKMYLVTSAARALFDEERRDRADLKGLRQFYLQEIESSTRTSFLNAMFSVYLSTYAPAASHTRDLANGLTRVANRLGTRWAQLIAAVPGILNPDHGHEELGELMFNMDDPGRI